MCREGPASQSAARPGQESSENMLPLLLGRGLEEKIRSCTQNNKYKKDFTSANLLFEKKKSSFCKLMRDTKNDGFFDIDDCIDVLMC